MLLNRVYLKNQESAGQYMFFYGSMPAPPAGKSYMIWLYTVTGVSKCDVAGYETAWICDRCIMRQRIWSLVYPGALALHFGLFLLLGVLLSEYPRFQDFVFRLFCIGVPTYPIN